MFGEEPEEVVGRFGLRWMLQSWVPRQHQLQWHQQLYQQPHLVQHLLRQLHQQLQQNQWHHLPLRRTNQRKLRVQFLIQMKTLTEEAVQLPQPYPSSPSSWFWSVSEPESGIIGGGRWNARTPEPRWSTIARPVWTGTPRTWWGTTAGRPPWTAATGTWRRWIREIFTSSFPTVTHSPDQWSVTETVQINISALLQTTIYTHLWY